MRREMWNERDKLQRQSAFALRLSSAWGVVDHLGKTADLSTTVLCSASNGRTYFLHGKRWMVFSASFVLERENGAWAWL